MELCDQQTAARLVMLAEAGLTLEELRAYLTTYSKTN